MTEQSFPIHRDRYDALMEVVRTRMTVRAFDPGYEVPREHYELILDAARHGPSGANAQPWHYIIVTEPETKLRIAEYFVAEQRPAGQTQDEVPHARLPGDRYRAGRHRGGLRLPVGGGRFRCCGTTTRR